MTYTAMEYSKDSGNPIELYEFICGWEVWRFTNWSQKYVYMGNVFQPSSIKRDRIKQSANIFKNNIKLTVPRTNPLASLFISFTPDLITTVTIFRGHLSDQDKHFEIYWKGRIAFSETTDNEISLECESVFTSLTRAGLRLSFEYNCPHALYQRGCWVDSELFKGSAIITEVNAVKISADYLGTFGNGYFNGGMIANNTLSRRFITKHEGNQITINRPIANIKAGDRLTVWPGCNKSQAHCKNKFNNFDNFGGFPFIPKVNPFAGSSII